MVVSEKHGILNNFSVNVNVPLQIIFVVPCVVQIIASISLVGYLSFRNSRKAVGNLAIQLQNSVASEVNQKLNSYLDIPPLLNSRKFLLLSQSAE